jgi:hypothetical protein
MFAENDSMPAIWVVYNDMKFIFVLIPPHNAISKKGNYFTIVMQRFLQDICRNILICPSDAFFSNFSTEHCFHGSSYETVTIIQVKKGTNWYSNNTKGSTQRSEYIEKFVKRTAWSHFAY